jgi:hypothetical protein
VHIVFRIENNGDDFGLAQAEKNVEVVALVPKQFGAKHTRCVDSRMIVVIL